MWVGGRLGHRLHHVPVLADQSVPYSKDVDDCQFLPVAGDEATVDNYVIGIGDDPRSLDGAVEELVADRTSQVLDERLPPRGDTWIDVRDARVVGHEVIGQQGADTIDITGSEPLNQIKNDLPS